MIRSVKTQNCMLGIALAMAGCDAAEEADLLAGEEVGEAPEEASELASPSEVQKAPGDWAPVYNNSSCKTASADWLGNVSDCSATVCLKAKSGWKLRKPKVVVEDNQGVGSGCGGPYKAAEVEDDEGNSYTTKYCADMWAQSHGGPFGSPGRIQCGLHAETAML